MEQINGLKIVNGFICEFHMLPKECTMDCDNANTKCEHYSRYNSGGAEGDKRFEEK